MFLRNATTPTISAPNIGQPYTPKEGSVSTNALIIAYTTYTVIGNAMIVPIKSFISIYVTKQGISVKREGEKDLY